MNKITFIKACISVMLSDGRGYAALDRRGMSMPEYTKHCRGERAVAAPIPTPISNAYTVDCNEAETTFLRIAGRQKVDPTLVALPHLLTFEFQEETYVVLQKADSSQWIATATSSFLHNSDITPIFLMLL